MVRRPHPPRLVLGLPGRLRAHRGGGGAVGAGVSKIDVHKDNADLRRLVIAAGEHGQESLEVLEDMVIQFCSDEGGKLDSRAIAACAEALRLLARYDVVVIEHEAGRRVIARWAP
jgi:hypothetical protein